MRLIYRKGNVFGVWGEQRKRDHRKHVDGSVRSNI